MTKPFAFSTPPQLQFGIGKLSYIPDIVSSFGKKVLLVTGARSFMAAATLLEALNHRGIEHKRYTVTGEPSPDVIDMAVQKDAGFDADVVVAIGGGSALDAGKAISAMLPLGKPVKEYLEGVGSSSHPGDKVPFVAVPTTAGTGSEATRNAVISEVGVNGYKRSLRHNRFVPDIAVVDPQLTFDCPPDVTAASGMDAFTQLLESYLSTTSNPMTDALALEGLRRVSRSLMNAYRDGHHAEARVDMAFASYLSGLTLANAGLGLVHGLASPVGGYFNIPHGVVCSKLMPAANRITVRKLRELNNNPEALRKYALVGDLFLQHDSNRSEVYKVDVLLDVIETWTHDMRIPSFAEFGITSQDLKRIAAAADSKNNPVAFSKEEMIEVLASALA